MADLTVRELTAEDWRLWRELRLAALTEAPYAFGSKLADWQGSRDREERWRARLAIPGSATFAATLDGIPVAVAGSIPVEADVVELVSVWVAPHARGRGVGDLLIRAVTAWAAKAGFAHVRLAVLPSNAPAITLYERHGFVPTGIPGDDVPGTADCELIMARPVSS